MNKILFGGNVYQEITNLDTLVNIDTDIWTWNYKEIDCRPARPAMVGTTWKYQFTTGLGKLNLDHKAYRLIGKKIKKIV